VGKVCTVPAEGYTFLWGTKWELPIGNRIFTAENSIIS